MSSKILFIHLYNNFTGSPNVLSSVICELKKNYSITLITNQTYGFLSDIDEIDYDFYVETTLKSSFVRWLIHQIRLGIKVWTYRKEDIVIYCNTIYPLGAGIVGWLWNKKVIYHLHEATITPLFFKQFAVFCVKKVANNIIVVSNFLKKSLSLEKNTTVIPNSVGKKFVESIEPRQISEAFTVLMLTSLNVKNKGIDTFIKLCQQLPNLDFQLVISDTIENIQSELGRSPFLIENLTIFPVQKDIHQFYRKAHLILNLSNPDFCIETFGLTVLEAMHYGIPTIVPDVGGITDLVKNGLNGYCVDTRNVELVKNHILTIANDKTLYHKMSVNALEESKKYDTKRIMQKIESVLNL